MSSHFASTATNTPSYDFSDLRSFDPALIAGLSDPSPFFSSLQTDANSNLGTHSQHDAAGQVNSQVGVSAVSQGAKAAGQPHMQQGPGGSGSSPGKDMETETFVRLLLLLAGLGAFLSTSVIYIIA